MYCTHCGKELADEAIMCPDCGMPTDNFTRQGTSIPTAPNAVGQKTSTLRTVTYVFMILGCIFTAFYFLIPLCWTIPMTVVYFRRSKQGIPMGTGFKVCTLLFVSLVAGILMLCDE